MMVFVNDFGSVIFWFYTFIHVEIVTLSGVYALVKAFYVAKSSMGCYTSFWASTHVFLGGKTVLHPGS